MAVGSCRRRWLGTLCLALVVAQGVWLTSLTEADGAVAAANDGIIVSAGPLARIQTTSDLNCAVNHVDDTDPEFYGGTACGTLVAAGGTLFGPNNPRWWLRRAPHALHGC